MKSLSDPILKKFLRQLKRQRIRCKRLYLFGSRATGRARPDSDYDVLVVLDHRSTSLLDRLYQIVLDLLLADGKLISLKIFTEKEFWHLAGIPTPFMTRVLREGLILG